MSRYQILIKKDYGGVEQLDFDPEDVKLLIDRCTIGVSSQSLSFSEMEAFERAVMLIRKLSSYADKTPDSD